MFEKLARLRPFAPRRMPRWMIPIAPSNDNFLRVRRAQRRWRRPSQPPACHWVLTNGQLECRWTVESSTEASSDERCADRPSGSHNARRQTQSRSRLWVRTAQTRGRHSARCDRVQPAARGLKGEAARRAVGGKCFRAGVVLVSLSKRYDCGSQARRRTKENDDHIDRPVGSQFGRGDIARRLHRIRATVAAAHGGPAHQHPGRDRRGELRDLFGAHGRRREPDPRCGAGRVRYRVSRGGNHLPRRPACHRAEHRSNAVVFSPRSACWRAPAIRCMPRSSPALSCW